MSKLPFTLFPVLENQRMDNSTHVFEERIYNLSTEEAKAFIIYLSEIWPISTSYEQWQAEKSTAIRQTKTKESNQRPAKRQRTLHPSRSTGRKISAQRLDNIVTQRDINLQLNAGALNSENSSAPVDAKRRTIRRGCSGLFVISIDQEHRPIPLGHRKLSQIAMRHCGRGSQNYSRPQCSCSYQCHYCKRATSPR